MRHDPNRPPLQPMDDHRHLGRVFHVSYGLGAFLAAAVVALVLAVLQAMTP